MKAACGPAPSTVHSRLRQINASTADLHRQEILLCSYRLVAIVAVDNGIQLAAHGVDAEGKPTHVEHTAKYDGQDSPVTGTVNADTVALKRIDANPVESMIKKAGTTVMATISPDGKTRTTA